MSLLQDRGGDVVVLGAGLIGLAIARELSKRGAAVRVIDAGEPGSGASWAGAGILAPDTEALSSTLMRALCVRSLTLYPAFVEELRAESGVDAWLRLDGVVELATTEAEADRLRAHVATLLRDGVAARWLDRSDAVTLEPATVGSVLGASLIEREGQVDNRRLGRALRAACERCGVRIYSGMGVPAIEADTRRVRGVRTPDGFVAAPVVINATGAWAGTLDGVPAHAQVPVRPVKGQMLALSMPRGLVRRVVWYTGGYVVPRSDGRLLVGATVENAGFDVRVTADGVSRLLRDALAALPALRDLAISETWAGLRPGTPDGLPFLGGTALEGYFVASGHYRNGILLVPVTARAIADVVENREPPVDIGPFSPLRSVGIQEGLGTSSNLTA
jgi:glycine oxidase